MQIFLVYQTFPNGKTEIHDAFRDSETAYEFAYRLEFQEIIVIINFKFPDKTWELAFHEDIKKEIFVKEMTLF